MAVHLIKLCVGIESLDHLKQVQKARKQPRKPLAHVTRMTPKRKEELLKGGSLYWVIKGAIVARQKIVGLEEVQGSDGIKRCALLLQSKIVPTQPQPRRPFQGWRYLKPEDAPQDIDPNAPDADMPEDMRAELKELGIL